MKGLTNNIPFQQQNHTTPYVFVFHNNSTLPKYCNSAMYSENKRYVLLKMSLVLLFVFQYRPTLFYIHNENNAGILHTGDRCGVLDTGDRHYILDLHTKEESVGFLQTVDVCGVLHRYQIQWRCFTHRGQWWCSKSGRVPYIGDSSGVLST